ncbi:oxidoreductase-like domain-containing protein [Solilutibacter oculi]
MAMTTPTSPINPDPRPQPPEAPLPSDCCDSGCDPCINDLYSDALARYRKALAEWRARHPEGGD